MTGITAACQADQAVAFAVPSGSGDFTLEPPTAVVGGPAAYREVVQALKALPDGSGITWYQELFHDGGPFTPVLGVAERVYGDSSTLNVMIRTDPSAGSPARFEIATSLIITRAGDPGDQRKIDYVLGYGWAESCTVVGASARRRVGVRGARAVARVRDVAGVARCRAAVRRGRVPAERAARRCRPQSCD